MTMFNKTGYVVHLLVTIMVCWCNRQCVSASSIQRFDQPTSIVTGDNLTRKLMSDPRRNRRKTAAEGATFYKSDWYYSQRTYARKGHLKNRIDPKMEKKAFTQIVDKEEEECIDRYGTGRLGDIACHGKMSKGKGGMMEGMMNGGPKTGKGMSSKKTSKNCGMGKGNIFCPPILLESTIPSIVPTLSFAPSPLAKGMMMGGMGKTKSSKCGKGKGSTSCPPFGFESSYPSDVPSLMSSQPSDGTISDIPTSDPFTLSPGTSDGPSIVPITAPTSSPTASMGIPTIAPTTPLSLPPGTSDGPSLSPTLAPTKSGTLPIGAPTNTPSAVALSPSITMVPSLKSGSPAPSIRSVASPTAEPTSISTTTSPIPIPSNRTLELRATPFSIAYGLSDSSGTPISDDHWMEAQNITIEFLQDYLNEQFDSSTMTTVDQYSSEVLEANVTQVPPSLAYAFQILFADSTTFFPSEDEIDIVIESAFVAPFADVLISVLQQLNAANPFSSTMTVAYTIRSDLKLLKRGRSQNGEQNGTSPPVTVPEDDWNYEKMIQLYKESAVKVPPFSLTYGWNESSSNVAISDSDPTIGETKAAANITLAYLDWYLRLMLNSKQPDSYVYMTGFGMSTPQTENVIVFHVGLQVQNLTNMTAMQSDVNMIVRTAFQPKYAVSLMRQMQASLPSTNPFSKTRSIVFAYSPNETNSGMSTLTITTIIVATCTFVLFCVMILFYRRRRLSMKQQRQIIPKVIIQYNHESIHGDLVELISDEGTEEEDRLRSHDALRRPLMDPPAPDHIYSNEEEEETIDFQSTSESVGSERHLLWCTDPRPLKYTEPKIFEHVD